MPIVVSTSAPPAFELPNTSLDSARQAGASKPLRSSQGHGQPEAGSSVTLATNISTAGRAQLMARVFHCRDPQASIPVATVDRGGEPSSSFLTETDRDQLARLYQGAMEEGIDLAHVDALAFDLADYRQSGAHRLGGGRFDLDGHPITYRFSQDDALVAGRILSNLPSSGTELDTGFVQQLLDPDLCCSHASDLRYLEHAMAALSTSRSAQAMPASDQRADLFSVSTKWKPGSQAIVERLPDASSSAISALPSGTDVAPVPSRREILQGVAAAVMAAYGETRHRVPHAFAHAHATDTSLAQLLEAGLRGERSLHHTHSVDLSRPAAGLGVGRAR